MLSRWRLIVLGFLFAAPFVFLIGYGAFALWQEGGSLWFWWAMLACLGLGYYLTWRWQARRQLLRLDFTPPLHWTDRDRQAWALIEARAKSGAQLPPDQLSQPQTYVSTAQDMALEMARFYHPSAQDPIGLLTIPELLAVVELAVHDLAELVHQYLPAGHLLTVNDWKRAKQAAQWYQTGSNIYWAISSLFNPFDTALRYVAAKMGMALPLQLLQQNLLLWFYGAFIHRVGHYLIELNSGRLRVGAKRYRELMEQATASASATAAASGASPVALASGASPHVTITLLGQVKVGKSSLINALLGEQQAKTGVTPLTDAIRCYQLQPEGIDATLTLLDTPGYGHKGPSADQLRATEEAARQSDLLLLVLHGRNPGRQADLELLQKLRAWFEQQPSLKMPRVLAVLTHIDLLSPALEWQPPYDWQQPQRPKEQQIEGAVAAVKEQLGDYLAGVVPVCTAAGKVYGVEEFLLPVLTRLLDEARAVGLLRCLRAEADAGRVRKVFDQLLASGRQLLKAIWKPV